MYRLARLSGRDLDLILRAGADVMLDGKRTVSVPIFGLAGIAFPF